jgi:serine/threonine-protein kinase
MGESPAQRAPDARGAERLHAERLQSDAAAAPLQTASAAPDAPSTPRPFGRFELTERIGAGGMAEVFRAEVRGPEDFRRELVIKRVLPRLSAEPRFTHMFVNEAKISAMLNHPNIVQIFEFGVAEGSYFIAMESVRGFTLREALTRLKARGTPMPVVAALHIARELLVALDYAHNLVDVTGRRLDIVHRDISPSNVMLASNGTVKVLDFGIARAADLIEAPDAPIEPAPGPGRSTPLAERDGIPDPGAFVPEVIAPRAAHVVKGKVPYLAPEQLMRGAVVDHRVDIFAVGCVLFEMLAGRPLFRCHSDLAKKMALLQQPSPAPSAYHAEVAPALDALVARAVERRPAARYGSAGEMLADVENHLATLRGPSRAILRLVRSLDPRPDASTSETFLTASASWVRPTIAGAPDGTTGRPAPAAVAGPAVGALGAVGAAGPSAPDDARHSGRRRRVPLGAAAAGLLLLLAAGVGAHAVAAYRARRAPPAEARRTVAAPTGHPGVRPAGSLVLGSQSPGSGTE